MSSNPATLNETMLVALGKKGIFRPMVVCQRPSVFLAIGAVVIALMLTPTASSKDDVATAKSILPQLIEFSSEEKPEAQYHLGMLFHIGLGVEQDYEKALELFKRASDGGYVLATYKLGCYYEGQGDGVLALDLDKAMSFKQTAAEAGYSFAQYDLAMLYFGLGELKNTVLWLHRSADQGYQPAFHALISGYGDNGVLGENSAEALTAFLKSFKLAAGTLLSPDDLPAPLTKGLSDEEIVLAVKSAEQWQPNPTQITIAAVNGLQTALKYVQNSN